MNKAHLTEKLIEKMRMLGYKEHWINYTIEWFNEISNIGVNGVDRLMRKVLTNAKPECSDHIAALRFTNILAKHNFIEIQLEPFTSGPDIKAKWNGRFVYFEVTRRHPEVDERADGFGLYTLPLEKPENIISKIQAKLRQLKYGEVNVVVFWSGTLKVRLPNIEEAFKFIKDEITENPGVYKKLSGVLFTTGFVNMATFKQFYLFKNDEALKKVGIRLTKKLESLCQEDVGKLQKKRKEIADALKSRLRSINS